MMSIRDLEKQLHKYWKTYAFLFLIQNYFKNSSFARGLGTQALFFLSHFWLVSKTKIVKATEGPQ